MNTIEYNIKLKLIVQDFFKDMSVVILNIFYVMVFKVGQYGKDSPLKLGNFF